MNHSIHYAQAGSNGKINDDNVRLHFEVQDFQPRKFVCCQRRAFYSSQNETISVVNSDAATLLSIFCSQEVCAHETSVIKMFGVVVATVGVSFY